MNDENNETNAHSGKSVRNRLILGITGGVGAGKSTILSYLKEAYGAAVIEADAVGHQVQQPGEPCQKEIVEAFGAQILNEDGTIDRSKLGAIVYADREKMNQLNAIVHPAIKRRILERINELSSASGHISTIAKSSAEAGFNPLPVKMTGTDLEKLPVKTTGTDSVNLRSGDQPRFLIAIEAALLLEDHYDEFCDEVWYIFADEQTRMNRLMTSRGYTKEKVLQIMSNQLDEEAFRCRCDAVIDNSSSDIKQTYEEIDRVLHEYPRPSGGISPNLSEAPDI
ncbi:MAG: dephospho-CoA kinase [Lachnospiraceae bacterium]|nr:dephospho-CoA kinase [Lachnospiraceae bacterium]